MFDVLKKLFLFFLRKRHQVQSKEHPFILSDIKSSLNRDWYAVGDDFNNVLVRWGQSYVKK
ncbi:hypothetical protein MHYMCMPSP_00937 [Hyalomma marginatum]|uniref:Uncharacterized protein n=1 Tax=Hyalomma marginatum TaxID=34627 RepID=A0A8S4BXQ7_9ACAR|nr:hypothetical protein MHYMCMPSP_00937 [Hyalomma marginatum]CAG7596832.1 hypothetical protein MHYMCMPASI_00890 [Hyalomma marginatum]